MKRGWFSLSLTITFLLLALFVKFPIDAYTDGENTILYASKNIRVFDNSGYYTLMNITFDDKIHGPRGDATFAASEITVLTTNGGITSYLYYTLDSERVLHYSGTCVPETIAVDGVTLTKGRVGINIFYADSDIAIRKISLFFLSEVFLAILATLFAVSSMVYKSKDDYETSLIMNAALALCIVIAYFLS